MIEGNWTNYIVGVVVFVIILVLICSFWINCDRLASAGRRLSREKDALDFAVKKLEDSPSLYASKVEVLQIFSDARKFIEVQRKSLPIFQKPQKIPKAETASTISTTWIAVRLKAIEELLKQSDGLRSSESMENSIGEVFAPGREVEILDGGSQGPRYWAGAFVFIGLGGTLFGLTFAVLHLMEVVKPGAANQATTKLDDVLNGLSAAFAGMGAAFASTFAGVIFTLLLSFLINRYEQRSDDYINDLETFLQKDLKPKCMAWLMQASSSRPGALDNASATDPGEVLQMLPNLLIDFGKNMLLASQTLREVQSTTATLQTHVKESGELLKESVDVLKEANSSLLTTANTTNGHLSEIRGSLVEQHLAHMIWMEATASGLQKMGTATDQLQESVNTWSSLPADLKAQQSAQTQSAESLQRRFFDENKNANDRERDLITQSINGNSEILQRMLKGMEDGWDHDRKIAERLERTLTALEQYTSHVEETIRDLPIALQSGPLIDYDETQSEKLIGAGVAVNDLREKIGELNDALNELIPSIVNNTQPQTSTTSPASEDRLKRIDNYLTVIDRRLTEMNSQPAIRLGGFWPRRRD